MKRAWNMYLDAWERDPIGTAVGTFVCALASLALIASASFLVLELMSS